MEELLKSWIQSNETQLKDHEDFIKNQKVFNKEQEVFNKNLEIRFRNLEMQLGQIANQLLEEFKVSNYGTEFEEVENKKKMNLLKKLQFLQTKSWHQR